MKVRDLISFLNATDPDVEVKVRIDALDRFSEYQVVVEARMIGIEDGDVGSIIIVGEEL